MEAQETIKKLSKFKAVIYDLDGTLVDLNVDWVRLKKNLFKVFFDKTGEKKDFTPLEESLNVVKTEYNHEIYHKLVKIIAEWEVEIGNYKINTRLVEYINNQKKQRFAIYSMNTKKCVEQFIDIYLEKKPELVIFKENYKKPKPAREDIKTIIEYMKIKRKEIVLVGDSNADKLSAEMAGIEFIKISII